ncbi:hypothetical protein Mal15_68840 [Stieleria maiorica]|uniref:Uncharacterized protein n=1 Tax=Stieleria maiorica TaxID=2795974 RepID=A0A5B9MN67_9BACT|nr:hypothetical protein Mal15_68840 [Stieleria maiorica]
MRPGELLCPCRGGAFIQTADDDDRQHAYPAVLRMTDRLQEIKPAPEGHFDVGDHHINALVLKLLEGFFAISGLNCRDVELPNRTIDDGSHRRDIIHDQRGSHSQRRQRPNGSVKRDRLNHSAYLGFSVGIIIPSNAAPGSGRPQDQAVWLSIAVLSLAEGGRAESGRGDRPITALHAWNDQLNLVSKPHAESHHASSQPSTYSRFVHNIAIATSGVANTTPQNPNTNPATICARITAAGGSETWCS